MAPVSNPKSKQQDFKALKAEWDKKLKDSGFVDIEQADGLLGTWHGSMLARKTARDVADIQQQKQEYYRLAGHFLWDYQFPDEYHRRVWELHAEGVSIRRIVAILKKEGKEAYRQKIHRILQTLVKEMANQCK